MIQRIQSLFLLLAAVLVLLLFAVPLAEYDRADQQRFVMTLTGVESSEGTRIQDIVYQMPLHALTAVLAAIWLTLIFLFRDRIRQARLLRYSYLVGATLMVALWITQGSVAAYLRNGAELGHALLPGFFLPIAGMAMAFLAERAIRKDEALVRSADRLR